MIELAYAIQASLDTHSEIGKFKVNALSIAEGVVLVGTVPSFYHKQMAGEIALRHVKPIKAVLRNELKVPLPDF